MDLRPVSRQLDLLHQKFVDEGLPAHLQREAFGEFRPYAYDAAQVARGKAAWQARVLELQTDLIVAARFLADLAEMGTSADIQGLGTRVVRDRERHVELSHRMVVALGGKSSIPGRLRIPRKPPGEVIDRVLRIVAGEFCVGCSLQMKVMATMGKHTDDELAKAAVNFLAADTAVHSRLGWQMLEVVVPALEEAERDQLRNMMPECFRAADARYRPPSVPAGTRSSGPTHPFGSLDTTVRARVYGDALEMIIDRFERLGLPGKKAWDRSRRG